MIWTIEETLNGILRHYNLINNSADTIELKINDSAKSIRFKNNKERRLFFVENDDKHDCVVFRNEYSFVIGGIRRHEGSENLYTINIYDDTYTCRVGSTNAIFTISADNQDIIIDLASINKSVAKPNLYCFPNALITLCLCFYHTSNKNVTIK